MPPDPRDWLPEGHLAWFVLASVKEMDLGAFYGAYRQDGWGRAAFEPEMPCDGFRVFVEVEAKLLDRQIAEDCKTRLAHELSILTVGVKSALADGSRQSAPRRGRGVV